MTDLVSRRDTVDVHHEGGFSGRCRLEGSQHVVELFGELDVARRDDAMLLCTGPRHLHVLVDLSGLVFLDGAGYGALVAARSVLEQRGGSLVLVNPLGAPRRLLELIESLERGQREPTRRDPTPLSPPESVTP